MSDTVITVENLSKRYRIRHMQQGGRRYKALRDVLADKTKGVARRFWSVFRRPPTFDLRPSTSEDFWALRDISFEVKEGEVLGIIGRNGAGKSTLLKILSRITEPTTGRVSLRGRVGSLLEVGTGFHPELTGRENIFLNGAILGMSRAEICRKFDEIVAFAGVEKFLDTPVKHYSSGMYVRLAFAVAAHLEPEILIIDEVLAVGDAQFQKKCLGKMGEVSRAGRTILFVSHQMASVANLCQRCILLDFGRMVKTGGTGDVIQTYLQDSDATASVPLSSRYDRSGNGAIRFTKVRATSDATGTDASWVSGSPGWLLLEFENTTGRDLKNLQVAIGLDDVAGQRIAHLNSELAGGFDEVVSAKAGCVSISLENVPLMPGLYGFTIFSTVAGEIADWVQNAGTLTVEPGDFFGTGRLVPAGQGNFLIRHHFDFRSQ